MTGAAQRTATGTEPKISVLVVTYNQERYLPATLDGILAQKTDFPYEVVVGEDHSTDNTPAVLKSYVDRFPARIRPLLRGRNLGAVRNLDDTLAHCRGEYVALVEGDDCWIAPEKLQRQCEFMDAHPGCSMSFHDARLIDADDRVLASRYCNPPPPSAPDMGYLLSCNWVPTCSVMFRRALLPVSPPEIMGLRMWDWPAWLLLAARGDVAYLPDTWAAYRKHGAGIWTSLDQCAQLGHLAAFYRVAAVLLRREPHHEARKWWCAALHREKEMLGHLVYWLVDAGRWREARRPALRFLFEGPRPRWVPPRAQFSLFMRVLLSRPSAPMKAAAQAYSSRPAAVMSSSRSN